MGAEPEQWNYFNYFTEVEEHFQRARGTGLFLLSPLDWALVEAWKNSDYPLEAVLRGIDLAFEKRNASKRKQGLVNSLAYCSQAVYQEAKSLAEGSASRSQKTAQAPFTKEEVGGYLRTSAEQLRSREDYDSIVESMEKLISDLDQHYSDLEGLEQRLGVLEERMSARARTLLSEEQLLAMRQDLDASLKPYRSKMSAEQLAMLERKYLDRALLDANNLPRLSLFYLR
jgi:flagellar motility protein MotE (MotC chaperone)